VGFDEFLAANESCLQDIVPCFTDQVILIGKCGVFRVLEIRVNPSVTDSDALEVQLEVSGIVHQVVGNGGDVMAGITLTSDVEVSAHEFRIFNQEP
jgi:hypothetical protein